MDTTTLLAALLFAHFLSSHYLFLPLREREGIAGVMGDRNVYLNALILFLSTWILTFEPAMVLLPVVVTLFYLIVQIVFIPLSRFPFTDRWGFFLQHIIRMAFLVVVCRYYGPDEGSVGNSLIEISPAWILYALGYLICLRPANEWIREFLVVNGVMVRSDGELEKAGRLIGSLERILVITFVLIGQFSAIGFLIAAKSILRFKEADAPKTEYVWIGTMLSFGVAIGAGLFLMAVL